MCGSSPAPPAPIPARQAAQSPSAPAVNARSASNLLKRATMSSTVLTNPNGMGAAATRGVSLLGQ